MKKLTCILICLLVFLGCSYISSSYGQDTFYNADIFMSLEEAESIPSYEQTKEEKIYEALFSNIFKGRTDERFYLVKITDNSWFKKNPFREEEWKKLLKDLGNISLGLVQELYSVNKVYRTVSWKSVILNPIFLPKEYILDYENKDRDKMYCLVEAGRGNVGVYTEKGQQYRSYYTVSKVAFSNDLRYALVKYSVRCAPSKGEGNFFISFEFKNNKWERIGYAQL